MKLVPLLRSTRAHWLLLLSSLLLTACGGGNSGSVQVTTLSAGSLNYSRAVVVTVNGSGLEATDLQMTVDGACGDVVRAPSPTDSQTQFGCQLLGVGDYMAHVRKANGDEIARLKFSVPNPQVVMSVTQGARTGTMTIEIDPTAAPVTALNFMRYVGAGFYNMTLIHRVVPGTLAQGGGYTTGPVNKDPLYPPIVLENTGLLNLRGTIAMARSNLPDSATAQYYLNIKDNPAFDRVDDTMPGYAVFGHIITGLDVLDEIGKVDTRFLNAALQNYPQPEVVVNSVTQIR
ncbi:MAG: peptidylprolyl isomerase [Pseudomonadota bacterium]|nr:peptidylprolyl isomerase [Pseudomonadota bacterium]